jgi:hypothetical protein
LANVVLKCETFGITEEDEVYNIYCELAHTTAMSRLADVTDASSLLALRRAALEEKGENGAAAMAPHAFCAETFVVALVCYSLFSLVYLLLLHLHDYCAQLCAWAASASGEVPLAAHCS